MEGGKGEVRGRRGEEEEREGRGEEGGEEGRRGEKVRGRIQKRIEEGEGEDVRRDKHRRGREGGKEEKISTWHITLRQQLTTLLKPLVSLYQPGSAMILRLGNSSQLK